MFASYKLYIYEAMRRNYVKAKGSGPVSIHISGFSIAVAPNKLSPVRLAVMSPLHMICVPLSVSARGRSRADTGPDPV